MANDVTDYKNVTEDRLLQLSSDYYDAVSIMAEYPECFEAYKSFIQKKRNIANLQGGGLTVDSSQQKDLILDGVTAATR